ncbi:hypothetical protein M404DRAFT_343922 [Pisolithus tinctorius Marx 270]|uniref:BZIP domain-containing protein n=1 Tax=Pisolithus tinctorius Marx 270 TaxID=870435 RepID=A0A0C3PJD2_PISTI|nr:hypothetical protein M404DRAFT_343922 [Pisolithus tinctorius Marx 270]
MPNKFETGHSPPDDEVDFKADVDESSPRMSDIALRKKKNADAQAAFRQRRANYIATLEETVTSLESVVLQLQDSCREARNEAGELRQDNARLRHELREREKFWRALWQARKTGQVPDTDDIPSLPSTFPVQPQSNVMGYQTGDDATSMSNGNYTPAPSHAFPGHSPSLSYPGVDNEQLPSSGASHQMGSSRPSKFNQYPYPVQTISRDSTWNHSMQQSSSSSGSPTLTSPEMYVGRSFVDEQKVPISQLETAPYLFPGSRSISPSTSTPSSSSTTSLTSSFQFAFPPENSGISRDRTEFDYRRHSTTHSAEVTLHGGTADLSLSSVGSEGVRYRIGPRRANSGPERPLLPSLPHFSGGSCSQHSKLRPRRGAERAASRSPSPSTPPISGTLAVIKAQAFGALRRTRMRTKKSSEGAAKVAMEVLEARGIGMGVMTGSKRPRLQDDHGELQT